MPIFGCQSLQGGSKPIASSGVDVNYCQANAKMSKQSFDFGYIVYIDNLDVFTVEMRSAIGQFREQHLAIIAFHRRCHHRQHDCHCCL